MGLGRGDKVDKRKFYIWADLSQGGCEDLSMKAYPLVAIFLI